MTEEPLKRGKSSLEQLKSLEQSGDQIKCLLDASRLAGVGATSHEKPRGHGRAEWVLRWLLQKFNSSDSDPFTTLKQNADAWKLLGELLDAVPEANSARLFQPVDIVQIATRSINSSIDSNNGSTTLTNGGSSGLKRKRDEARFENQSEPVYLIQNILQFFSKLVSKSRLESEQEDVDRFQIKSVLRVSSDDAAGLLHACLTVIGSLSNTAQGLLQDDILAPVLTIWRERRITADDEFGASAKVFSSKLLVAAMVFYGHSEVLSNETHYLEELFYEHLLAPLRINFMAQKRKNSSQDYLLFSLMDRFKPLKDALFDLPESEESKSIRNAFPKLFRIAVRRSGISTSKSKSMDEAWLENLLRILLECTGDIWRNLSENSISPHQRGSALEELLTVAISHKLSLSTEFLGMILFQASGLFRSIDSRSGKSNNVRISIITRILELNPTLFVHLDSTSTEAPSLDIKTPLFAYISQITFPESQNDVIRRVSKESFVSNLVVPLMEAHAKLRKLAVFISQWFDALKSQSEIIAEANHGFSAWTNQLLIDQVSERCKEGLPVVELKGLLRKYINELQDLESGLTNSWSQPQFSASLIILEALLGGVKATSEFLDLLEATSSFLKTLILSGQVPKYSSQIEGRLWRLLSIIQACRLNSVDSTKYLQQSNQSISPLLQHVGQTSHTVGKNGLQSSSKSAFNEMFTYGVSFLANRLYNGFTDMEEERLICSFYGDILSSSTEQTGDPASEDLIKFHLPHEVIFNAAQVAARYPSVLQSLSSEYRSTLYLATLTLGNEDLLEGMKETIVKLGSSNVQNDWMAFLSEMIHPQSKAVLFHDDEDRRIMNLEAAFDGIMETSMSRKDREKFIDLMIPEKDHASSRKVAEPQNSFEKSLFSIARLISLPFEKGKLYTDPTSLLRLGDRVDMHVASAIMDTESAGIIKTFRFVVNRILSLHISSQQDSDHEYIDRMKESICGFVCKTPSFFESFKSGNLGKWVLTTETITLIRSHNLSGCKDCEEKICKVVTTEIEKWITSTNVEDSSNDAFNFMLAISLTKGISFDQLPWTDLLQAIMEGKYKRLLKSDAWNRYIMDALVDFVCLAHESQTDHLQSDWQLLYRQILDISDLSPSARLTILKLSGELGENHNQNDMNDSAGKTLGSLMLRYNYIQKMKAEKIVKASSFTSEFPDEVIYKQLLPTISQQLKMSTDVKTSGYALTDILEIVNHKPFLVDQFGVESVLAALLSVCCQPNQVFLKEYGATVYLKICQILNILLLLHRKHLGDRMHLLTPVIETLMSALIIPHRKANANKNQRPPVWISTTNNGLDASHANVFVRLLQTFTHPTVSSVSRASNNRPGSLLTDETRKARKYAADCVPYLLTHYCGLQLIGRFSQQVRKALMPGIWECIEIVPHEKLLAMSAKMGRDEREIWRSLWAEWKKVQGRNL